VDNSLTQTDLVSVIVPVYNGSRYILSIISSVLLISNVTMNVASNVVVMGMPAKPCNWLEKMFPEDFEIVDGEQEGQKVILKCGTDRTGCYAKY